MPLKPPREVVYYRDKDGACPALDVLRSLQARVETKVRKQVRLLENTEWDDLLTTKIVKTLKGSEHICEVRLKGRAPFNQRVFFFLADCRGKNEAVVTEIDERSSLDVTGRFDSAIKRGEQRRADWMERNCPQNKKKD